LSLTNILPENRDGQENIPFDHVLNRNSNDLLRGVWHSRIDTDDSNLRTS